MKIIVFKVNEQSYGIPIEHVLEISHALPVTPLPANNNVEGLVDIRDKIYGVVDLRKVFNIQSASVPEKRKLIVLNDYKIALLVDDVSHIQEIDGNLQDSTDVYSSLLSIQMFPNIIQLENELVTMVDVEFLVNHIQSIVDPE